MRHSAITRLEHRSARIKFRAHPARGAIGSCCWREGRLRAPGPDLLDGGNPGELVPVRPPVAFGRRMIGANRQEVQAPAIAAIVPCRGHARIARRARAAVGVMRMLKIANSLRIACGMATDDRRAAVPRAVVDQQQLPVGPGLREDARDCLLDEALRVQEDHDHGDQWLAFGERRGRAGLVRRSNRPKHRRRARSLLMASGPSAPARSWPRRAEGRRGAPRAHGATASARNTPAGAT